MKAKKFKQGMVFGVFDGLHEGHKFFLREAKKRCQSLSVVVTHDDIVPELKHHRAKNSCEERIRAIHQFDSALLCLCGDPVLGQWTVLRTHKPDMVLLGYDQRNLARELEKIDMPFSFLPAYRPEQFKTSLLQ